VKRQSWLATATDRPSRPGTSASSREDEPADPVSLRREVQASGKSGFDWRDLSLRAHMGGRYRDADVMSWEVGGSIAWRAFFIRAGYQLPATWYFEERPVEVAVIPLMAGWRPTLWQNARWRFRALFALLVEQLTMHREDLQAPPTVQYWDAGLVLGLTFAGALTRQLEAGLRTGVAIFPRGGEVLIPNVATTRFNRYGLQLGLFVAFGGGGRGS
jgi:hypothetical protein